MQRVFRIVNTADLEPGGPRTTNQFNGSVRRNGVVNPVLLAEVVDGDGVIELAIIDGNRRIRAAQIARLPKVPAVVLKGTTKQDRARLTLMCNSMRSANFHTESAAILALAANENAAAGAARAIGLGPVKIQQLYRKIATMPEPVRQAMYEHRIPVTAATWVGAWPEGLQQELIELLGRRRYVNTTMVKDLREWYAERHPREFGIIEQPDEDVPFDEWSSTDLHVIDIPAPPSAPDVDFPRGDGGVAPMDGVGDHVVAASREPSSVPGAVAVGPVSVDIVAENAPPERGEGGSMWSRRDDRADTRSAPANVASRERPAETSPASGFAMSSEPPAVMPRPAAGTPLPSTSPVRGEPTAVDGASRVTNMVPDAVTDVASAPRTTADDRAERMVAFVVRLDAALRDLVREGKALGIDRSVWVDRAMRAWDGIGG